MSEANEPIKIPNMMPKEIVAHLDKYIIGQDEAKKSIAIAIRNRYRRSRLPKEMQEEIANDFTKGTYIVAVQNEGKAIPLVKIGEDQLFWPLFTDVLEFQKFNKNNAMKPMVIKADKVPQLLPKEAKGVVFNPLGVNMPLTITKKAKPADQEGAESAAEAEAESAVPEAGGGAAETAGKMDEA